MCPLLLRSDRPKLLLRSAAKGLPLLLPTPAAAAARPPSSRGLALAPRELPLPGLPRGEVARGDVPELGTAAAWALGP
jgi:hypothetical protein